MLSFLNNFDINFLNIYLIFPFIFALIIGIFSAFFNPIQTRLFSKIFFIVNFILATLIYLSFGFDTTKFLNISFSLDNISALYLILNSLIFLIYNLFSKTSINRFHKLFYPVMIIYSGLFNFIILTDNILALFILIFWYILINFLLKSTYLKERKYFSTLKKQFALDITIFFITISLFALNLAQYFINIEIEPCYKIIQALLVNIPQHCTILCFFGFILICVKLLNLFPFLCLTINNTNKINSFVSIFLLINSTILGSFLFLKLTKTFPHAYLTCKNIITIYFLANIFYYVFASFKNKNVIKKLTYLLIPNVAIALLLTQIKEEIFILYLFYIVLSYSLCYFFCFVFQRKFKSFDVAILKKIDMKNKALKIIYLLSFLNLGYLPLFWLFIPTLLTLEEMFIKNNIIVYLVIFGIFLLNLSIFNFIYQLFIEKTDRLQTDFKLSYYQFLSLTIIVIGLIIFSILPIIGSLF